MDIADLRRMAAAARTHADAPAEWYSIHAEASGDEATVYIYDEISSYWGITADDFARELAALDVGTIHLRLNSPGGLVFDGVAIYNLLRSHRATVHVVIDGLAASIASIIAMAGDTVTMGRGTQLMIHNPRGLVMGESQRMRDYADLLDRTAREMAGFYVAKAGGDVDEWLARMAEETWYTGQEAVDAGLADAVSGEDTAATDVRMLDLAALAARHGFRYAGRDRAPGPSTRNKSELARARHRVRHGGAK